MSKRLVFIFGILIFAAFALLQFVDAQTIGSSEFSGSRRGTASYVNYGSSFSKYYGSEISTYWPVLNNRDECTARQDILIQVSSLGCQPAVVRSDLLAEQNVPVFCQLDLLQINPAIDVKQIRSLKFNGKYPSYVSGVGFHPARAALRTRDRLLGSPLQSNIGYVVIVLKKSPQEKDLPGFFNFTLSATVDYYSGNAIGLGVSELLLAETNDQEWKTAKNKQIFFKGKYSVRLLESDLDSAQIALYRGDVITNEITLSRQGNQQTTQVYLPGSYCQTALQFTYSDFISSQQIARIQVDDDVFDVYDGAKFLDNKCSVRKISGDIVNGSVEINCGKEKIVLANAAELLSVGSKVYVVDQESFALNIGEEWTITKVDNVAKNYTIKSLITMKNKSIEFGFVRAVEQNVLNDATYGDNEKYILSAIREYENVADTYGDEKKINDLEDSETLGELALNDAIELAKQYEKKKTVVRLIEKYLSLYPDSDRVVELNEMLNDFYTLDTSASGATVETDDGFHYIKLLDIYSQTKKSNIKINWDGQELAVNQGETTQFSLGSVTLTNLRDAENVDVNVACTSDRGTAVPASVGSVRGGIISLRLGDTSKIVCGSVMRLANLDIQRFVKLKISPETKTSTTSNFTVGIGIEKRAIELTPSKARKKIENLNNTIKKWESISENLGTVVKGLKAACFVTAGVLTVKNFFTGLSGEALARKEVMNGEDGWTKFCQNEVNSKFYSSLTECYNNKKNADDIAKDVDARTLAIKKTNEVTKAIESAPGVKYPNREGLFAGQSFDDVQARKQLIAKIKAECSSVSLGARSEKDYGKKTVGDLFPGTVTDDVVSQYSYTQLRDIYFNCQTANGGGSSDTGDRRTKAELDIIGVSIAERQRYEQDVTDLKSGVTETGLDGIQIEAIGDRFARTGNYYGGKLGEKDFGLTDTIYSGHAGKQAQVVYYKNDPHLIVLNNQGGTLTVDKSFKLNKASDGKYIVGDESTNTIKDQFSKFELRDSKSYYNQFARGEANVRYFDTEPYKGMPAVVPFDLNKGFYAATTQSLPILGQTKSFEANGRPSSFFVCNVMKDGRVGFYSPNYGDDECVQFNIYTGQSFTIFPGLSEEDTKKLVSDAVRALEEAAQQYGKKNVKISGNTLTVGNAASLVPGTQCQNFMSPEDCKILFNVCDPVICPASRCNFGGAYQVADVIQSGIVGSAFLCLPNYKEGIVLPVCLTGIKAGIDGYLSIMKSYQACLQESIDTGQYVGVCDQIHSVYLCEFFWRQLAPLANVILPKVVEYAYTGGQGNVRGGGEYLTVQESWKNAEDSVKYFTQTYAVNSIEAFQVRSIEEAGTPFCKAFISAKGPKTFENLIEPDSPPQFSAWFSTIPFTDATVPATAQYKVFYHIFAGKDRGVSYSVYLKDPPTDVQYSTNPFIIVATGFAARGGYETETRDFTAPVGYKQLCVRINDKEECGFKQVSSSFAINYVRDNLVNDELKRADITTESQCISGGVASPLSLLNPNIQEGAQEAIDPAIYNRGIVRICATKNPGTGTDPSRFVQVGYCGEQRLGCWLDKKSIDRAITDANVGLSGKTLSEINQLQRENLFNDSNFASPDELNKKLTEQIAIINRQTPLFNDVSPGVNEVVIALDDLNFRAVFNNDRANILFWKATAYSRAFANIVGTLKKVKITPEVDKVTTDSKDKKTSAEIGALGILKLAENYTNGKKIIFFEIGEKKTKLFTIGREIRIVTFGGIFGSFAYAKVGDIRTGERISLAVDEKAKRLIDKEFGDGAYDKINGKGVNDVISLLDSSAPGVGGSGTPPVGSGGLAPPSAAFLKSNGIPCSTGADCPSECVGGTHVYASYCDNKLCKSFSSSGNAIPIPCVESAICQDRTLRSINYATCVSPMNNPLFLSACEQNKAVRLYDYTLGVIAFTHIKTDAGFYKGIGFNSIGIALPIEDGDNLIKNLRVLKDNCATTSPAGAQQIIIESHGNVGSIAFSSGSIDNDWCIQNFGTLREASPFKNNVGKLVLNSCSVVAESSGELFTQCLADALGAIVYAAPCKVVACTDGTCTLEQEGVALRVYYPSL